MIINQLLGGVVMGLLLYYLYWELTYGGGDPNSKDHNRPPWNLW